MFDAPLPDPQPELRRDLRGVLVAGRRRAYRIVVDEISGRFTRISEHVWQSLANGDRDQQLWREARAAGWTRERQPMPRKPFTPLFFRVPLGTIDPIASLLAPRSGIFFSVTAMLVWTLVIAVAGVLALSHSTELVASLGLLRAFLHQSSPLWIGSLFVATKVVHELAHGVMCRRMGSRCAGVGILFLCGIPCPYCDVTDIWRQPSSARRAAVMLAGIYAELIMAAIATFVWIGATDPTIRLHALNLMIVCGISTLVFNANPLMRYDGYYVLCDLVGSTNLRQEARDAFRQTITKRIAGRGYQDATRSNVRSWMLASFHAASTVYRLAVCLAIATLLVGVAEFLNLRSLAIGTVMLAFTAMVVRLIRRVFRVLGGTDRWQDVPAWRRGVFVSLIVMLVAGVMLIPLPRYRTAVGQVDAALASSVFLPGDALVDAVGVDYGETVQQGDSLVRLRDETFNIRQAKLRGQLRVARLRSSLSRRVALDRSDMADQWKTLQAAEEAVAVQLASVEKRISETNVRAPVTGVVLPVKPSIDASESQHRSLHDQVGTYPTSQRPWCRISDDGMLYAVFVIDARDRTNVDVGSAVRIGLRDSPEITYPSNVVSVSAIHDDQQSATRRAAYQVLCPLPPIPFDELMCRLGTECTGVFHLPNRTLADDMGDWIHRWIGG